MEKHRMDERKLRRNLDALFSGWIERRALPCAQAAVIRNGQCVYEGAHGVLNLASKTPLPRDAIFRIYSMTKVFTSVCMLMLLEEGRYKMHDPLSKYIPEYKSAKVSELDAAGHQSLMPPRREIRVRDLFTMASGLPYPDGDTPSERAMEGVYKRADRGKWDTQRVAREMAKVPLTFHPGEHWWYGVSIDVLGALVEVLSGQTLGAFMKRRVFDPLDLRDTGFYVPEEKRARFVSMYEPDAQGVYAKPVKEEKDAYLVPPAYESGGGGLVSTMRDVSRFARLLLGFGEFEGQRLLSRKSVELMRTNHLDERQLADYDWDTQRGYGYGLGVRVMMRPEIAGYGSVGEFGWDGYAGTWFSVDPEENMIMIFLTQIAPGNHDNTVPYFAQVAYGAIDD